MGGSILPDDQKCEDITFYGLSTCMWCRKTKKYLDDKNIAYTHYFVNELERDEQDKIREEVKKLNPNVTYPTVKIGDRVVVGYHPDQLEEALATCQPSPTS